MDKNELEELRQKIKQNSHNQTEMKALEGDFFKTQRFFHKEREEEKDQTIKNNIRAEFLKEKPQMAAELMLNQISKWMRRINERRD